MTNALLMVSRRQAGCWYQRDMSDTHHYRHNREHCESAFSRNLRGSLLTSSLESPAVIRARPSAIAIVLPNHQAVQLNATNDTPNSVASLPVFPSYHPHDPRNRFDDDEYDLVGFERVGRHEFTPSKKTLRYKPTPRSSSLALISSRFTAVASQPWSPAYNFIPPGMSLSDEWSDER